MCACRRKEGLVGEMRRKKRSVLLQKQTLMLELSQFKWLLLEDELVKRGFLYLKSLVWHEFMVPCRGYRNEGGLGFQLVCEHNGMVHRYRSHLLGTHKVGW